jgi:hypothetical protein
LLVELRRRVAVQPAVEDDAAEAKDDAEVSGDTDRRAKRGVAGQEAFPFPPVPLVGGDMNSPR